MTYNSVEINTSVIDHFVYRGTYETYLGEYLGVVAPDEYEAAETRIGNLALEIIAGALWDVLPYDVRDDFELVYKHTFHPSYYNFQTDHVAFDFKYSDDLKDWLLNYATDNQTEFNKFLHDNYTPRSGFIPHTPNNWDEWLDGWNEYDWLCVSAMLNFFINQEISISDRESYEYDFDEKASEIISGNYTPWEYAEKFDNGWIGVCKGEWDEDEQATVYTAYLLDADGNAVATATNDDPYDDYYRQSAYAAWEYGDLKWELTKDRVENRYNAVRCEVPEIKVA